MSEYLFTGWTKKQMAAEYLRRGMLPIPLLAGSKQPAVRHAPVIRSDATFGPPAWDRPKAMAFTEWDRADYCLGVLSATNAVTGKIPFVIDCDMPELFNALEAKFPEAVASAGLQETRKGFHVVFARSEYADQRGVFDNFKMYLGGKHAGDIKTVTKSVRTITTGDGTSAGYTYATPGNVAVFPSANKFWVRLPEELPEVPDKVVDWVFSLSVIPVKKGAKRSKVVTEEAASEAVGQEVAVVNLGGWTPTPSRDLACLRALGFSDVSDSVCKPYLRTYSGEEHIKTEWASGCYQFHSEVAPCPMCAKPEGHQNNHYFVLYSADGDRYVLNFSSSCVRGGRRIDWTREGRSAWRSALAETPHHVLIPHNESTQAALTLPLETHVYARALRELNPAWSLGNVFKPKDDGRFAGFIQVRGVGKALVGITHDGFVEIGEKKAADNGPYNWSQLTASAGRILDKDLTAWFAKAFPYIERDDDGVFLLPVCHVPCLRVGDARQDAKTRRQHAHCVMRTRRPWTRLRELEEHRSIKEDPA